MQSVPDSHRDLLDGQFATLVTIGQGGHPQLSEPWFLGVDGQVAMSLNTSRQKVKNLRRRPECSVLLLDLINPYRYVEIRGDARIQPDHDYTFADLLGAKYGSDVRTMDGPGESRVVVTVRPTRVRTWG